MATGQLILDPYSHISVTPPPLRPTPRPSGWGLPVAPNFCDWRLGDVVLVSGTGVAGAVISIGQQIIAPQTASGAMWSHAGIYVGDGRIVEAKAGHGIVEESIEPYCYSRSLAVLRLKAVPSTPSNAGDLVAGFAQQRIGDGYAWRDLVSLVGVWRKGVPQAASVPGNEAYCSALVVQCYGKTPVSTALDTATGCLPCMPSTLSLHPWLDDVPLEWCKAV